MLKSQESFINYLRKAQQLVGDIGLHIDHSLLDRVIETELVIPVIGAFSSGKSTLMNTLIGRELLPVGIAPETELATELRYSPEPYLLAVKLNGETEKLPVDSLNEVNKRSSEFSHLRLYVDSDVLKRISPLVLVDMPGFGSSLENHNKAIAFYLPRGVHFIVVTSVEDGTITASMLRKMDEIKTYNTDFTFVLSKCNLRASVQVEEVKTFINDQLSAYFSERVQVVSVSHAAGEELIDALSKLQPDDIFYNQFIEVLKEQNLDFLSQINLSVSVLKKDRSERERALQALDHALETLLDKKREAEEDLRSRYSGRMIDRCLNGVERGLNNALDELVALGKAKNQHGMTSAIGDIVRESLLHNIKSEVQEISTSMVDSISAGLDNTNTTMLSLNLDSNWSGELSGKVKRSLELTTETLTDWTKRLSEKKNEGSVLYRTLTTVLAVTTSVVNPLVELALIFLPELFKFFMAGTEEEKIRSKLANEIFPGIKAELRKKLPTIVEEQLNLMLDKVALSFEQQVSNQRQLINKVGEEDFQVTEENNLRMAAFESASAELKSAATQYLYR